MKNVKKVIVISLVTLVTLFNVVSIASATTTYKDGTYDVQTGDALIYKLHVVVSGGKITAATTKIFYGTTELTAEIAATNEQVKPMVDAATDYNDQLVAKNDGSKITKRSDDSGQYATFMELVQKFEAKAVVDNATSDTSVPKTGVFGLGLVYGLGALVTGAFSIKRSKK